MPTDTATADAPARSICPSSSSSARRHPSVVPSETSRTSGLATAHRLLEGSLVTVDHRLAREPLALAHPGGSAHPACALRLRRQREQRARDPGGVASTDQVARLAVDHLV